MRPQTNLVALAVYAVCGCVSGDGKDDIIVVGNPPSSMVAALAPSTSSTTPPVVPIAQAAVLDCEDGASTLFEAPTSWTWDGEDELTLPEGDWCGLVVGVEDSVVLEVQGESGGEAALEVPVYRVVLSTEDAASLADVGWWLEVGTPGFLDEDRLGIEDGSSLTVRSSECASTTVCVAVMDEIEHASGLYEDRDGDGALSDSERESGARMAGEDL